MEQTDWATEPIAIVGLACRFAGDAKDPEKLWQLLADGRSAWSSIPSSRFNLEASYHPNSDRISTTHVKGGHFLEEDVGLFDAAFFNMSAETAATLDPQYRLQLEIVYEALENAGITLTEIAGSNTSVFAGVFSHDYRDMLVKDPDSLPRFYNTGLGAAMASNRISHFFDLRGPSLTVDTGCSTTAVALHQACQSLRYGESEMSIVGGSSLLLDPGQFKSMASMGVLSAEGKSYTFDSRATGYGRGDGVAAVVLKRLKDARAAHDPIRAVIRETMVNQDGKTETITTPSQAAQEALTRACYQKARLSPLDTQYFEAHGTGTRVGDPIEARSIDAVFHSGRPMDDPLRIGSVKTNIGHTEPTSGLAGVIKVVLALEKGLIPPTINFVRPNKELEQILGKGGLKIARELERWPARHGIRRASIASFGYGGTNAHVIMESAATSLPASAANGTTYTNGCQLSDHPKLFVLSAKNEQSLQGMTFKLRDYLLDKTTTSAAEEKVLMESLAYTLDQRRTRFNWIAAYQAKGVQDLIRALESPKSPTGRASPSLPRIGFVFTGQGANWHAMGRDLVEAYPIYRAAIMEAEGYLKEFGTTWSLLDELGRDAESARVTDLRMSVPICVAMQIALTRLLSSWGINPTAVTSHSSGEIAAACAAGVLSYRSAMLVAWTRSYVGAELLSEKGGMLAIGLDGKTVERYIDQLQCGRAVVGCYNSPSSVTVSGEVAAIEELESLVNADGVFCRRLKVSAAYHSWHMDPLVGPCATALRKLKLVKEESHMLGSIAYSSPCTGGRMTDADEIASPEHWARTMPSPVLFVDAFRDMVLGDPGSELKPNVDAVIEVGPHAALAGPISDILKLPEFQALEVSIPYVSCLVRHSSAVKTMQEVVTRLLREGYPVNIEAVNSPRGKRHGVQVLCDLPPYSWNHQVRHWAEPRYSKTVRVGKHPPHNLLGSLEPGFNPNAPTWRKILRLAEMPWVRDHIVQSDIVYPGAGYICLAIEAVTQTTQDQANGECIISGYRLRDVDIVRALVIPDTLEEIEVQTKLRPAADKEIGMKGWWHFEVLSVTVDNKWTKHATGMIVADLGGSPNTNPAARRNPITDNKIAYTRRVDPDDFYGALRTGGIQHGPIFRNIKTIQQSPRGRSLAVFSIAHTTSPNEPPGREIVHPTTLDSVFQAAYTALSLSPLDAPKIPRTIKHLRVAHGISREPDHEFQAYTSLERADSRRFQVSLSLVDSAANHHANSVLAVEGLTFQAVGTPNSRQVRQHENEVCATVKWAPDISLLPPTFFLETLTYPAEPSEIGMIMDLRRICLYYIYDALADLTESDAEQLQGHQRKFYCWMRLQTQLAKSGQLGPGSEDWLRESKIGEERQQRVAAVGAASVNGEMVLRLGPNLAAILRQRVTTLELMLEERLLYKYYLKALKWDRATRQLAEIFRHLVHKTPHAKVLEVGAGTGGATRHLLNVLGTNKTGGPLAAQYDFTDVSSGFFEAAQENFAEWSELLTFRKLDIERSPAAQGFETGGYDIVVAGQVLHATTSIENTLSNVRSLLKPGGKLLLIETTHDQLDVQFSFGLLPGWWLSEEKEREWSPSFGVTSWDRALKTTGFSGIDVQVRDCESNEHYATSTMMSTAKPPAERRRTKLQTVIVVAGGHRPPESWLATLRECIATATGGPPPEVEALGSTDIGGKVCIFLGELTQPFLQTLDAADLEAVKGLAMDCKGLLWVTRGGAVDCENPVVSLAAGLLRSLRLEYAGRRYVSLDLDPKKPLWATETVSPISCVLAAAFDDMGAASGEPADFEFAERDGVIVVPRCYKDMARNKAISPDPVMQSTPTLELLHQPDRALRMTVGTPGLLDTLAFRDDASLTQDLPDDFVQVMPMAFGLNFRDVMVALGQIEEQCLLGCECSGVITSVGSVAASNGYTVGDRVFCVSVGVFASCVRVPWTGVMHIPGDLSFEVAASFPVVFATAYFSLYDVARLEPGQSLLIHAAAGGVGQAAIILAKLIGVEVFATVGTPEKRALITEKYDIPADHIFSSRDASFGPSVRAMTGGRGVDVVLNSLGGPLLQESANCLAPMGHFVEIGKRDLEQNNNLELRALSPCASFSAVDLVTLSQLKGRQFHQLLNKIARMMEDKTIKAVEPLTVYSLADCEKVFRLQQTGKHMGKLVFSTGPREKIPIFPRTASAKFSPYASYLLVGGVGGIGRSVAQWMVTRGAKNLVLLSRSASVKQKTGIFIAELEQVGCRVKAIGCDVSDSIQLALALQECRRELPPIRGVVQAAMILQDSIFERMTIDDWNTAIRPKVQGSWNLHKQLLHADLDFFIMLSSIAGVMGHASQCNYSAGGAFQDALARYRVAQGFHGVSIDLGIIKSVGYVAETRGVFERMSRAGCLALSEEQMLAVIESAILSPHCGQVVTGLNGGLGPHWNEFPLGRDGRFTALRGQKPTSAHPNAILGDSKNRNTNDLGGKLAAAPSLSEAKRLIIHETAKKLADIFMIPIQDIDTSRSLADFGVDSLVAIELRNMLALRAGADISTFEVIQSPSLVALASTAAEKSTHIDPGLLAPQKDIEERKRA